MSANTKGTQLYSLEVFVHKVGVSLSSAFVSVPAICFRFLEFPLVVIHKPALPANAHSEQHNPLSSVQVHEFERGKSCLFRMTPAALKHAMGSASLTMLLVEARKPDPFIDSTPKSAVKFAQENLLKLISKSLA